MIFENSIRIISNLLKKGEISAEDLVNESFDKIEALDSRLHSFITLRDRKDVLKQARVLDAKKYAISPLSRIPFSVKDAFCTKGVRTTAASRVLDSFIPPYSATAVQKLISSGAVLIGKNNMDAWGHGGSTENTDYGLAKNPWDLKRSPGGSSGGSASAVSTRMVSFAIGEDTGGSIRNPAAMCSITGLKPTYGRVSRYGSIAYASSLDSVGPMAKSAEDIAFILELIAGKDPMDATSSPKQVDSYSSALNKPIKGKVIGIVKEFYENGLDKEAKDILYSAVKQFEYLGANIIELSMPMTKHGVSVYYLIAMSETSSNMGRYDGIRYGNARDLFSKETVRRILLGTYALSAGYADELYKKAQKARTLIINEYNSAFEKCDIILSPVIVGVPPFSGELISDPLRNLLEDMYTVTVNLVGVPSLALPAGFTTSNLPIGMQLIGKKFHEKELLQFGHAYQQATDWHTKVPPVVEKIL